MGTRGENGRAPWIVVAVAVGVAVAVVWFDPRQLSSFGCLVVLLAPLGLFGGVALLIQRARERRELVFGSELREAVRADTAVLHRVSVAIPARDRESVQSLYGGEAHAHRMLDAIAAHVKHATPYAHLVEPLDDESTPSDEVARVATQLEGRVYGAATDGGYRAEARERRAKAGEDGAVVVSVLVVARPTAQEWRPVLGTRDAKALPDAILPIDPTHILASALVVTPDADGLSFDASALREAFPELIPLDEKAAAVREPEPDDRETDPAPDLRLLSELRAELPSPVAAIELDPASVDDTIAETMRRLEQHFGLPLPIKSPLKDVLRTAAAELDSAREDHTRERLLSALELTVNTALWEADRDERIARLVGSGGVIFREARFLAIDDETRDALRKRTDVLFAPRPFESLRDVIPMLATLAVFGTFAIHWLGPGVPPAYLIGTAAASLLSRWWVARRNRGLALGANWEAKYVAKPRPPRDSAPPQ